MWIYMDKHWIIPALSIPNFTEQKQKSQLEKKIILKVILAKLILFDNEYSYYLCIDLRTGCIVH